jgi:hypothetical protein
VAGDRPQKLITDLLLTLFLGLLEGQIFARGVMGILREYHDLPTDIRLSSGSLPVVPAKEIPAFTKGLLKALHLSLVSSDREQKQHRPFRSLLPLMRLLLLFEVFAQLLLLPSANPDCELERIMAVQLIG